MISLFYSSVLCRISILIGTQFCKFQIRPSDLIGNITICPAMNINFLFVGGASIFAKFLS